MKRFADLLERLLFAPQRNAKLAYLSEWIRTCPSEDRGWGIAALTGDLDLGRVKGGLIRRLAAKTIDEDLFAQSYDFVGDLAETTALIWPRTNQKGQNHHGPHLAEVVETLRIAKPDDAETIIATWLDQLDETARWGLLKLITGGMRVGVSARMVRLALAAAFDKTVEDIEEIWPLITPPYDDLFAWLDGTGPRPSAEGRAVFRPLMLAHPIDDDDVAAISPQDYLAEWKWDGARVQLAAAADGLRLFSRSGDMINDAFPELTTAFPLPEGMSFTLDGELLAGTPQQVEPFQNLQQRLNRKKAGPKLIKDRPVFIRVYDILINGQDDLRTLPIETRRDAMAALVTHLNSPLIDLSEELIFKTQAELAKWRAQCRDGGLIEGVMLKSRGSSYQAGRIKGLWYKWKRDPLTADVVLMYAQRGHGKRSSFFSDYTFGAWMDDAGTPRLVPVGKAYSGFTDAELKKLDEFVRKNTTNKFGPVREIKHDLVVEVAFDSLQASSRHKSGIAMRFPRFARIRWDKPAAEADTLDTLKTWLD